MNELEKLLTRLEPSIKYLSKFKNIAGMDRKDIAQELRLIVFQNYDYNKDKNEGWWFIKLKWFTLNLIKKTGESKKPLDNIDDSVNLLATEDY